MPTPSILTSTTTSPSASRDRDTGFSRLERGFIAWLDAMDPDVRETIAAPAAWGSVSFLALLVIAVAGVNPGTRKFFDLAPVPALLAYLPTVGLGLAIGILQRRGALSAMSFGVLAVVDIGCFQFFMWSLVGLSKLPDASVMASLPILLACYHGYVMTAAPGMPYVAVAMAAGAVGALAWHHQPETLPIFAVGVPVAIGSALILGRNALAHRRERGRNVTLREAIDAQILSERGRHAEVLSQALARLQGTSHDAGNALSGVLFNLEELAVEARRSPLSPERCERIGAMATDLCSSLDTLRSLLVTARDTGRETLPTLEKVVVAEVLHRAVLETRGRFPHVRIDVHEHNGAPSGALASVSGGETTLRRIFTNLLTNACEGNGATGARKVDVRLASPDDSTVVVSVEDDGPGFSSAFLESPFRDIHTSKAGGLGLGLYVSERLVRVSGGRLQISNRQPGPGARVEASLPRIEVA